LNERDWIKSLSMVSIIMVVTIVLSGTCRQRVAGEVFAVNDVNACFHMAITVVTLSLVNFLPRDRTS
jgi:ABC-type arginine transport system permease subunit